MDFSLPGFFLQFPTFSRLQKKTLLANGISGTIWPDSRKSDLTKGVNSKETGNEGELSTCFAIRQQSLFLQTGKGGKLEEKPREREIHAQEETTKGRSTRVGDERRNADADGKKRMATTAPDCDVSRNRRGGRRAARQAASRDVGRPGEEESSSRLESAPQRAAPDV
jgi:hypothetical protein